MNDIIILPSAHIEDAPKCPECEKRAGKKGKGLGYGYGWFCNKCNKWLVLK